VLRGALLPVVVLGMLLIVHHVNHPNGRHHLRNSGWRGGHGGDHGDWHEHEHEHHDWHEHHHRHHHRHDAHDAYERVPSSDRWATERSSDGSWWWRSGSSTRDPDALAAGPEFAAPLPTDANRLQQRLAAAPPPFPASALQQYEAEPRPVVGVLTQPYVDGKGEYIAASYVKFLESAGLRVIPIRYTWSDEELGRAFRGISGLLFAGGDADIRPGSKYYLAAAKLYKWAMQSNARGEDFPIFGTCLGWELLSVLAAGGNYSVLADDFEDAGRAAPIKFTVAPADTRMFKALDFSVARALQASPIAYFSHHMGVTPRAFEGDDALKAAFRVVAVAQDANGKEFVAAAEGRAAPVFAVQFHPEKAAYEWYSHALIPHGSEAVAVTAAVAGAFGNAVRASKRRARFMEGEREAFTRDVHAGKVKYLGDAYFSEVYLFGAEEEEQQQQQQ